MDKFRSLEISDKIIRALNEMGFEEPTPIQEQAIPPSLPAAT
jgi:ATP-dependent RNA helicase DeaD